MGVVWVVGVGVWVGDGLGKPIVGLGAAMEGVVCPGMHATSTNKARNVVVVRMRLMI